MDFFKRKKKILPQNQEVLIQPASPYYGNDKDVIELYKPGAIVKGKTRDWFITKVDKSGVWGKPAGPEYSSFRSFEPISDPKLRKPVVPGGRLYNLSGNPVVCPHCASIEIVKTYGDRFECQSCGAVFN